MNFDYTSEQVQICDMFRNYLADQYDYRVRQARPLGPATWRRDIWDTMAKDLQILGVALPEAVGGMGGGAVETMIVMEALGAALSVEPWLPVVVIAGDFLRRSGGETAFSLLSGLIEGRCIPIPCFDYAAGNSREAIACGANHLSGSIRNVLAGGLATHLLVPVQEPGQSDLSVFALPVNAPGIEISEFALVDGQRAADITFRQVPLDQARLVGVRGGAQALIDAALDTGVTALCAEAVGVMRELLAATVDYARQRRQFGRAIADFQVIQHRMADMFIALEEAVSMTYLATLTLDDESEDRASLVSAAKVKVGQSARFVGESAVQIHGGMGMSLELKTAHLFTRATVIEAQLGSTEFHLERYRASAHRAAA